MTLPRTVPSLTGMPPSLVGTPLSFVGTPLSFVGTPASIGRDASRAASAGGSLAPGSLGGMRP
jgi:hypothetical protein